VGEEFLIKIFESNRKSLALHETALLSDPPHGLAGSRFGRPHGIEAIPLPGLRAAPRFACSRTRATSAKWHISLRTQLLQLEPPQALVTRYRRSRPLLGQRIDRAMLLRLRVAIETAEQERCAAEVVRRLPSLLERRLDTLPLVLLNPDMNQATIWVDELEEKPVLLNWTRWSLDPAGAGWGEREEDLERLVAALEQAVPRRPCLSQVRPKQAKLSALTYALEARLSKQQFPEALDLVARILELLDLLDEEHRHSRSES
jgi:hypothetical protein